MGNTARNAIVHAAVACAALAATTGCDIVQGFQDAGDALFPPQKTYLETPGFRLARGAFRRLNVAVGNELFLLARSSEDPEPALFSMRYLDPEPCRIPGVVRYWASGLPTDYPAQIAYLDADVVRGTLRFVDARCNAHDNLVFENAELPWQESTLGVLVAAGSDLLLVDPPKNSFRTVVRGVQRPLLNGPGAHFFVVENRLEAYSTANWNFIGAAGENVVDVRGLGSVFLFEDATGIHSISVANTASGPQVVVKDVDPEGCRLGWVSGSFIAYYSPCADQTLALWNSSTDTIVRPNFAADPGIFAVELDAGVSGTPDIDRDYWYYTLGDLAAEDGPSLVIRSPEGDEFVIGKRPRLDRTNLDDSGDYGLAIVDAAGETGRLVRWNREGAVETIATDVFLSTGELIVNWNGAVGDRARLTEEGELEIFLNGVPRRDYDYGDAKGRWRAVFDESKDGVTGTLSIDDSGSRTFANKRVIAENVRHPRHEFLDVVLPGIAYISHHEATTDTGRLEYNNLELGFRGIISDGVGDFIPAGNGILYTVPFGSAHGIWLARAQ